jgi:glycosyl transferase, family 25
MRKIVINLRSREDRRAEMEAQLSRIGWQAEFFAAVRPEGANGFPSIGAHGCFLSHLSILRQAKENGFDSLVIMEDDLDFVDGFREKWEAALSQLLNAAAWSIFYPGNTLNMQGTGLKQLRPLEPMRCTHFMMFNSEAIGTIVSELEKILARPPGHPDGGPMHVDGAYSTIRAQNPELTTFCYSPTLGYQRASRTDIGENKIFDRIEFLRTPIRKLRKIKSFILKR